MSAEQYIALASLIRIVISGQMEAKSEIDSLKNEVASLKAELARLHQVGVEVDEKLEKISHIGKKISKKL